MSIELKIPVLGESIENGQVVAVKVAVGDTLATDQTVLELETGKAVVEVPSEQAGTVEQVLVSEGDEVKVGQPFIRIGESSGEKGPGDEPEAGEPRTAATGETEGDAESETAETRPDEIPPEPEPHEPESEQPPRPRLPDLESIGEAGSTPPVAAALHVPAAPSVRRFARELGVNIETVRGSGPHGRVSIDDVKRHARDRAGQSVPGVPGLPLPDLPDFSRWGAVRREKMSGIRYATAEQVARCWSNIPRVTHFDQADITNLEALRLKYRDRAATSGGNLTMAVMVVKVVALALKRFPQFNASIDMAKREIVFKDYVNVGIAVATDRGLMVPVLRDADKKNMVALAGEIGEVAAKCREGKIAPDELTGGTFTVTNLGSIGGSHFTPIVNFPEVAILGMGRSCRQLTMVDREIESRMMLPLSLSYDHRLIDGADAARFTRWVCEAIEEPLLLSLEG